MAVLVDTISQTDDIIIIIVSDEGFKCVEHCFTFGDIFLSKIASVKIQRGPFMIFGKIFSFQIYQQKSKEDLSGILLTISFSKLNL